MTTTTAATAMATMRYKRWWGLQRQLWRRRRWQRSATAVENTYNNQLIAAVEKWQKRQWQWQWQRQGGNDDNANWGGGGGDKDQWWWWQLRRCWQTLRWWERPTTTTVESEAVSKMTMVTVADGNDARNLVGAPVVVARKVPWKYGGNDGGNWPWCD